MSPVAVEKPARREWVKAVHRPGGTFVTVTLVELGFTAKWTTKAYATTIPAGIREARAHAQRVLAEMHAAIKEFDAEEQAA